MTIKQDKQSALRRALRRAQLQVCIGHRGKGDFSFLLLLNHLGECQLIPWLSIIKVESHHPKTSLGRITEPQANNLLEEFHGYENRQKIWSAHSNIHFCYQCQ